MQLYETTELAAGKVEVIPLDGITIADQCQYSLRYEIVEVKLGAGAK